MENKEFTITKKIAKHGSQAIIIIPKLLERELPPGVIARINIEVIERRQEQDER